MANRHRIAGDDSDLPAGWTVDSDNWGTRALRAGDLEYLKSSPPDVFMRSCCEGGALFVHTANAARKIDGRL